MVDLPHFKINNITVHVPYIYNINHKSEIRACYVRYTVTEQNAFCRQSDLILSNLWQECSLRDNFTKHSTEQNYTIRKQTFKKNISPSFFVFQVPRQSSSFLLEQRSIVLSSASVHTEKLTNKAGVSFIKVAFKSVVPLPQFTFGDSYKRDSPSPLWPSVSQVDATETLNIAS